MTPPGASVAPRRLRDLVHCASEALGSASEARWIVAHATGMRARDLMVRSDTAVAPDVSMAVSAMVDSRLAGRPLQYVLGTWGFRTLDVRVDPRALIPRPETEQIVSAALEALDAQATRGATTAGLVAVDLGTGSGAIALSLALEFDGSSPLEVWATDVSADALDLFDENLTLLAQRSHEAASRVHVASGSWFDALPGELVGRVDVVVSNPPYVSESEWESLEPVVRDHEPVAALVSGPTGLEAIETLLEQARRWLAPGGSVVVEIAPAQAIAVERRARELGYDRTEVRDDLAGRQRMVVARIPRR
jgi:release factor glutamine methyltransferase